MVCLSTCTGLSISSNTFRLSTAASGCRQVAQLLVLKLRPGDDWREVLPSAFEDPPQDTLAAVS